MACHFLGLWKGFGTSQVPGPLLSVVVAAAVPEAVQEDEHRSARGGEGDEAAGQVEQTSRTEKLKEEMDEILDEIDSVLEENAEEFVKSYVQKGGE